jgi:hypothetical protein
MSGPPTRPSLSTRSRSGLPSKRGTGGMVTPLPEGGGSLARMPGSRKGRPVGGSTPMKTPDDVAVALASFTLPSVGATTVSGGALTRMPSSRSSCSMVPPVGRSVVVIAIGAGSGLPIESCRTVGDDSSVSGGWSGSWLGTNSVTVPVTCTRLPTAAAAGGGALVNTNTPSDVFGSAS